MKSAAMDVFGSWWGAFEFFTLFAIVAVVCYIGVNVLQRDFTTRGKLTPSSSSSLGGDCEKLFKTVMSAVDTAPVLSGSDQKDEYADEQVSTTIRHYSQEKMKEAGLDSKKHPNLTKRVIKRTAALLGLKIKEDDDDDSKKTKTADGTPFKTIDVRIDTSSASSLSPYSSIVKVSILDGVLPDNVPLPFYMIVTVSKIDDGEEDEEPHIILSDTFPEFASSSWPPKTNMVSETPVLSASKIIFDNVHVKSLLNGILLDAKDKKQKTASIFDPRNKLNVKMEAYTGRSKVLLYHGETSVSSPLPGVKEILSCKNFALVRIDDAISPYYESTYYSEDTLNEKYVSEYPRNMPQLTPAAIDASNAAPRVLDHATSEAGDAILKEPAVAFVYGKEDPLPVLTHKLYNEEIKRAQHSDKYIVMPAQDISVLRNPARPTETYMSMSLAENSIPSGAKLMGWVVGFESCGVLSGQGGFNVVFPAYRSEESYADLDFPDAMAASSSGSGPVVLHNTEKYIGCFGNDETLNDEESSSWDGPVNGERYFSYHLRPCIVIRWKDTKSPPKIAAIMTSPATDYAAKRTTRLLPRALSVSAGPLPTDNNSLVNAVILGGGALAFEHDKTPEKLYAVFPTLRTKTGLVDEVDEPYAPLHSILSRNRSRALSIRKIVTEGTGDGHAVIKVFDEETSVTLGGAMIQLEEGGARPVFIDGARDDRPFSINVSVFGKDDKRLPVRPTGNFTGQFLNMTAPEDENDLWKNPAAYTPTPEIITLPVSKTSVVFCRTTHPPVSNRGQREPFMKFCGLVPFPNDIPEWAFVGSLQSKFPRHIFISSVRDSDVTSKIINSDGTAFSPEQWLERNLHTPSLRLRGEEASYVKGEKVYARLYLGKNALSAEIDQTIGARNRVAWIVSETGTKMENLLITNELDGGRIVGKWGIIVFGANPHPEEPADRYTNWRTAGRLRMVVEDPNKKLPSISQPVTPLQVRLATWSKGDPVIKKASGEIVVRLDPRIGGVGSANGLYNENNFHDPSKMTTSILFVIIDTASRKVKYVQRVPLCWKLITNGNITDNIIPVDRESVAQRRMWNRTTFDHDNLMLCVNIPNIIKEVDGTAMLVDHLVFACSASLQSAEKRAEFYKIFVSSDSDVIYDKRHSNLVISVPFNFSTTCGFVIVSK